MITQHRVYRINQRLRDTIKATREITGKKNIDLITDAVEKHLPQLLTTLTQIGLTTPGKTRPARLPINDTTLKQLRQASTATTIPASTLLTLCLQTACGIVPASPTQEKAKGKPRKAHPATEDKPKLHRCPVGALPNGVTLYLDRKGETSSGTVNSIETKGNHVYIHTTTDTYKLHRMSSVHYTK